MAAVTESSFLPFDAQASVWADIKPVLQDDGPAPLCPILYSPDYSQAMDLLRALLPIDELSPRSLALTEHLSKICPSNYTIWHYRARILINGSEEAEAKGGLGSKDVRLNRELDYLDDLAKTNMKSYQVWQHRKLIVTALGDPQRELSFVAQVLSEDAKNYHTWVYRQWVLAYFGGLPGEPVKHSNDSATFFDLWKGEMEYVDSLLKQDVRNNSAWNHRYFCLFGSRWAQSIEDGNEEAKSLCSQENWRVGTTTKECIDNEVAYAKGHIKLVPNNASAWNYLRGVSKLLGAHSEDSNPFDVAVDLARSLVPSQADLQANAQIDEPPRSPPLALEWLLDHVDVQIRRLVSSSKGEGAAGMQDLINQAEELVRRLTVADVIRKRYWSYRLGMLRKAAGAP